MQIQMEQHTVREVFDGYVDSAENGVYAFGGKLSVRPPFQREFVYKEKDRNAVIDTIIKGFPLNVMYWCDDGSGNYELLDGQQRTISFCQYCNGDFSVNNKYYHNLTSYEQQKILDYKLMIYVCTGNDKEKLDWFKTINIAGEILTAQELRNAVYTGSWLSDAKKYFSKNQCAAYQIGSKLLNGETNRQAYLETAIKWKAASDGVESIEQYMAIHQHDINALPLWQYFQSVITWVNAVFPKYRKEMKGIEWGMLYNEYKEIQLNATALEENVAKLMADDDVTAKKGIYPYLLTGKEKYLNIRAFTDTQKRIAYEKQGGICPICKLHFSDISQMEGDHITPWRDGGKTEMSNLQMLCKTCNREKGAK